MLDLAIPVFNEEADLGDLARHSRHRSGEQRDALRPVGRQVKLALGQELAQLRRRDIRAAQDERDALAREPIP